MDSAKTCLLPSPKLPTAFLAPVHLTPRGSHHKVVFLVHFEHFQILLFYFCDLTLDFGHIPKNTASWSQIFLYFLLIYSLKQSHPHARRVFASSSSTGQPGDWGALQCQWNACTTDLGLVSASTRGILSEGVGVRSGPGAAQDHSTFSYH